MSAWLALLFADAVAVSSFARCFSGPGELTVALATLLVVHLAGLAARRGLGGQRGVFWALGVAAAVLLPVAFVLGSAGSSALSGHATWHALSSDLGAAWTTFRLKVAPVPELPGLVLATAWASGLVGFVSELLSSRRKVPAGLALVPALGAYLFASALGTASWRALSLGAMAASACWYLVAVVREREGDGEVLVASLDTGLDPGDRSASYRAGAVILRMSVLAALAAALIGPNLPGARSVALVAWRGDASATATTAVPTGSSYPRRLQISTLVEVGQEEVDDPSVALFKVHSSMPTKELIATLDEFNGNSWSASPSGAKAAPGTLSSSLSADENQPPPAIPHGLGHAILVQVFEVDGLGGELAGPAGYDIPAWGYPVAVAGAGQVSRGGPGGSIVSGSEPREGTVYGVSSIVGDASPAQLQVADTDTSDPVYLKLPAPVPPRLVRLADSLVVGATSPYQKALHLEAYLTSSRFRYHLPARAPSGSVAPSRGYGNLLSFLFDSRTGYCQQFATAFAVLARIDGLPTRIAVGFLPGNPVGHDAWQVDGKDTHAWPQVLFDDYGWIDFEPTPGAGGSSSPVVSASPTTSRPVTPTTSGGGVHPTNTSPTAAGTRPKSSRAGRRGGSSLPPAPWLLVLVLAVLAWAAVVPLWRRVRLGRPSADPRVRTLAAWGEASRTLDLAGLRSRRGETYLELSQRAVRTGVLSDQAALALADLAQLVTAACYGASPPAADGARRASEDAKTVVRSARASVARWQRIAAALDPRSLPA